MHTDLYKQHAVIESQIRDVKESVKAFAESVAVRPEAKRAAALVQTKLDEARLWLDELCLTSGEAC